MQKLHIRFGFFLLTLLIAGMYGRNPIEFISWMGVVFISILVHELGHALMALVFRRKSVIELSFLGGTTYFSQEGLKKWQLFLICLNGPLFGFLLYLSAEYTLTLMPPTSPFIFACKIAGAINLFWTLFNLLPIIPMDGGQLLRLVFETVFKNKGLFFTALLSLILATLTALVTFLIGQYFIGSILFMFSFQNFEMLKQARYLTSADREASFRKRLEEGVFLFETGKIEEAKRSLEALRAQVKKGMIYNQATAMIALILKAKHDFSGVYLFLKPFPKLYETELAAVMHEAAFFNNDLELVAKLSAEAFQKESSKEIAYHAAIAAASFHQKEAALGWLKTALELGLDKQDIQVHPLLKSYLGELYS